MIKRRLTAGVGSALAIVVDDLDLPTAEKGVL